MNTEPGKYERLAGIVIIGGLITGGCGLLLALYSFQDAPRQINAGLALVASALAFGLLANALLRK